MSSSEPRVADAPVPKPGGARQLLPLAALAIILPAGVIQGVWSGRWTPAESFDARLAALGRLPLKLGDWTGRDLSPEERVFERAGAAGGLTRRYEDGRGGVVSVLLICGRPGPISVHTPEICYAGAGYAAVTPRVKVTLPANPGAPLTPAAEFWATDFRKSDSVTPDYLRIFYAWTVDGTTRPSANPRLDFAGTPALYKLYVVRPTSRLDGDPSRDPATAFIRQFLPAIKAALQPSR